MLKKRFEAVALKEYKSEKLYYTMGEVSEMFDVNPSLIRFWEQRFDILKPKKNKKGNRLFTPTDVKNLEIIYHLVKERGMTLAGAEKYLKSNIEGVARETEIVKRLQEIRSLLVEVREELKEGPEGESVYVAPAAEFGNNQPIPGVMLEPEVSSEIQEAIQERGSTAQPEPATKPEVADETQEAIQEPVLTAQPEPEKEAMEPEVLNEIQEALNEPISIAQTDIISGEPESEQEKEPEPAYMSDFLDEQAVAEPFEEEDEPEDFGADEAVITSQGALGREGAEAPFSPDEFISEEIPLPGEEPEEAFEDQAAFEGFADEVDSFGIRTENGELAGGYMPEAEEEEELIDAELSVPFTAQPLFEVEPSVEVSAAGEEASMENPKPEEATAASIDTQQSLF